ncbi:MAG: IS4 family transposase [Deltaproteobacteria bacterium]|nr:IS4 family transposase [Deltaproteobacteria bacterium]
MAGFAWPRLAGFEVAAGVEQLSQNAGKSIQVACEDWAGTKAAYRFFDNPKIKLEEIMRPHIDATACRAEKALRATDPTEPLLIIQDTSYLNYSHHPSTAGLGEISKFKDRISDGRILRACGLLLHSSLALTTDGIPLGFLDQKLWTRTRPIGVVTKSGWNFTRIPIEEKESFRWIEAMRNSSVRISDPGRLIHIGDREADIFELFGEAKAQGTHFVIRLKTQQRCVEGGGRIFDQVETVSPKGRYKLRVRKSDGSYRIAKVEVKFYPVAILPSVSKKKLDSISAWVIAVIETGAPKGVEKIDWKLLTDLPVRSFESACEKIYWYEKRWQIEVFHKVLKSGCRVLDCRLQDAARLIRYVGVMTVVAWRIFWMTTISRHAPELKPEAVMAPSEMATLNLYVRSRKQRLTAQSSAHDWIRSLASLGGFLGRKCDAEPGPFVLWRGYLRLQDIMLGISLVPP